MGIVVGYLSEVCIWGFWGCEVEWVVALGLESIVA